MSSKRLDVKTYPELDPVRMLRTYLTQKASGMPFQAENPAEAAQWQAVVGEKLALLVGFQDLPAFDPAEQINEEIFAEISYHASYEPQRAVRTNRWKYIARFDGRSHPVLPNCDDNPSKNLWLQLGWRDRNVASEQLYDLIFDPNEAHNLANEPSFASTLNQMRDRLNRWMHATDDPLLCGPIAAPKGPC